jgi:predicted Zn-dependent protease
MAGVTHRPTELKLVRVGSSLPSDALRHFSQRVRAAFAHVLRELEIVQYDPPAFERIEASLLTQALEYEIGGQILAVTDADLLDSSGDGFDHYMFGGKDNRNAVAVVSTARLRSRRGELRLDRVIKVGLHELGHNFGLGHHYSFERSVDGYYCPMSKGDFNGYGERGYLRAVIDGRGFAFCRRCLETLRRWTITASHPEQEAPG